MHIVALFSVFCLLNSAVCAGRADLPDAAFTVPLTGKTPRRQSKREALAALRGLPRKSDTVGLDGAAFDDEYLVNITVGGKNFQVILDTGSSDTWVAHEGFSCLDLNGTSVPASTCDFGPAQFNPEESATFRLYPNVTFYVRYGSGEFLSGPTGFDTVAVGGLSVTQQEIGVPNLNAFLGDGVSEGVFGLAFPGLTSVWNTTNLTEGTRNQIPYSPFFLSAVHQNKVKNPFFSISIDRPTFDEQAHDPFDPSLGSLAFGGIVPVPVLDTVATVPIQAYAPNANQIPVPSSAAGAKFEWYAIDIDSYTFSGSGDVVTKNNNTILDSGTTLNWVPTAVAEAYNALFSPAATLDPSTGMYVVDCNSTAPDFSVVVGATSFAIDPQDQVVPLRYSNGTVYCVSGTGDEGPDVPGNLFILGDVFLHNVVATYNPIDGEVTLTQRAPY
ncbi:acid protease [Mycena maculata]|uniref:Acid protease n=1 Tax=Mycena maculata TaxID=230809 RepID=A0AAD7IAU0_9AGAR|nr:acid protease [Mycena maculata]